MLDIKITRTTCPKEKPQDESKLLPRRGRFFDTLTSL